MCSEDALLPTKPRKVAPHAPIGISTRKIDRAKLGQFLASFLGQDVLIPGKSAFEPVELEDRQTTLAAVIERAGLVVGRLPAG